MRAEGVHRQRALTQYTALHRLGRRARAGPPPLRAQCAQPIGARGPIRCPRAAHTRSVAPAPRPRPLLTPLEPERRIGRRASSGRWAVSAVASAARCYYYYYRPAGAPMGRVAPEGDCTGRFHHCSGPLWAG